jgi:hypothetical protein
VYELGVEGGAIWLDSPPVGVKKKGLRLYACGQGTKG